MSSSDHGLERPSKRVRLSDFPKSDEPSPTSVILAKADPQEGNERDRGSSGGGTNEIERERRVGIAAFATPNEGGFTGTFKQRYLDPSPSASICVLTRFFGDTDTQTFWSMRSCFQEKFYISRIQRMFLDQS